MTMTTGQIPQDRDDEPSAGTEVEEEPIYCSQTTRCRRCYGKPSSYTCMGCFCFCLSH
ncbi:hypothetical protein [Streptomyces sp. NPDC097619]|uniref:hypothetical protein n=1 Tax=Streptomyces sp. NPDC097619 TaxID=3157228 RepID=UPI0033173DFF